jgi:hypothetical protein
VGARPCSNLRLAGEEQRDGGDGEQDANDGESVAEGHDQSLPPDRRAERDNGLGHRGRMIRHAVRHEIGGHLIEPAPHLVPCQRDRLADDVRVELLALGEDRAERRRADRAAQVPHHVG